MLILSGAAAPQRYTEPVNANQGKVHVPLIVGTVHATGVKSSTCIASAAVQ